MFAAAAIFAGLAQPAGADENRPVVIAHRGAPAYLPEHTLAGKAMAHAFGADFIEQDVVLTKDGVPIVMHDITLDATTDVASVFAGRAREDGKFYAIDFTLEEIRRLRVMERQRDGQPAFDGRFPRGGATIFRVPTLQEELDLIKGLNASTGRRAGVYPEIKSPAFHRAEGQDISRVVLNVLAENGYSDKDDPFFLQSFDWNEVQRIRSELGFKGKLVQLIGENRWDLAPDVDFDHLKTPDGLKEIAAVADGIGPWIGHVLDDTDGNGEAEALKLAPNAQDLGLTIHAYTFRADRLPKWAASFDILLKAAVETAKLDGLFTDHADLALSYLNGHGE
ncbi:glycerophosphodiester phosphodiesterase [Stappia sp. GBMRC 2046]|uniref:glycerophosphodiester phosphodiesterase n=2 Tax=Stappia sediminis TaxID=2692190 RepID=A0A7X3LR27_9HYPH|nr:glycerophosphodiester phosphodiesterase [Stappia sediminis]